MVPILNSLEAASDERHSARGRTWHETTHAVLTAGTGVGRWPITAFDSALRAARIADFNLIRVSSIVPPGIPVYRMRDDAPPVEGLGRMVPTVYESSTTQGEASMVCAAVGVGLSDPMGRSGVIFTFSGTSTESEASNAVADMIAEGMESTRRRESYVCQIAATSARSVEKRSVTALAALFFCDEDLWELVGEHCIPVVVEGT